MVLARVRSTLDASQTPDQAGFRSGYACDDNLLAIALLSEKMKEYQRPLTVVAVDFQKAFDTVEHFSLWEALAEQQVPKTYIEVLIKLYEDQTCQVIADRASKVIRVERGTKQGDPLSPPLFNAVLEKAMLQVKRVWLERGLGLRLEQNKYLTNLRFADDILLVATSIADAAEML
eukprot:12421040-Karenia_brevis.AAC.1